ncbi:MAG: TlyA family RNA methyltransferase [Clostridiales bacterium]|jgi:23S rRNA (cytidine1920-2'-O)/16S rRNA (cytidine1409-2'-O)-methyltransferase|nr:TlyA family RNA methyltransferase [Clostridiales bacterium]
MADMITETERLDAAVARRCGFSRAYAKEVIEAGKVFIGGAAKMKPGEKVRAGIEMTVRDAGMKYVGRGGYKLEKALAAFGVSVENKICIDVGASTGGFTDCMLQKGAARVYAIDAGTAQLSEKLSDDSRVVSMEKTKFQDVGKGEIPDEIDFIAADIAFSSLSKIMENIALLLGDAGEAVLLVKPQFEAGKGMVDKKGVVKDARIHKRVIAAIYSEMKAFGLNPRQLTFSPFKGQDGNIEYLICGKKDAEVLPEGAFQTLTETVVTDAFAAMKKA